METILAQQENTQATFEFHGSPEGIEELIAEVKSITDFEYEITVDGDIRTLRCCKKLGELIGRISS